MMKKYGKKTFAEKVRDHRFKRLANRTYKKCDKYKNCDGCPFVFYVSYQGEVIPECKLIKWESNGAERYPYEYPSIFETDDHTAKVNELIEKSK